MVSLLTPAHLIVLAFIKSIADSELILEIIAGKDERILLQVRKVPYFSKSIIKSNKYKIAYFPEINEAEGIAKEVIKL